MNAMPVDIDARAEWARQLTSFRELYDQLDLQEAAFDQLYANYVPPVPPAPALVPPPLPVAIPPAADPIVWAIHSAQMPTIPSLLQNIASVA